MKLAVKPKDIALPKWLQRIGADGISRIQVRLAQIHNSRLGAENWGYTPFGEAFDAIAIELSEDPSFGERIFYIRIRKAVLDLARELGWLRPERLKSFDPMRALPEIVWEGSILGRLPGKRWTGAYTKKWAAKRLMATPNLESSGGLIDPENNAAQERRGMLAVYKARARKLGIRITDKMIANAANPNWNDRTMVTWWKRNDSKCKVPHDKLIKKVLSKDPSLVWPKSH